MSGDGMGGFVTALTETLNTDSLWTEVTKATPLITGVAIFAFGYFIVRKVIKGAGKGKIRA